MYTDEYEPVKNILWNRPLNVSFTTCVYNVRPKIKSSQIKKQSRAIRPFGAGIRKNRIVSGYLGRIRERENVVKNNCGTYHYAKINFRMKSRALNLPNGIFGSDDCVTPKLTTDEKKLSRLITFTYARDQVCGVRVNGHNYNLICVNDKRVASFLAQVC